MAVGSEGRTEGYAEVGDAGPDTDGYLRTDSGMLHASLHSASGLARRNGGDTAIPGNPGSQGRSDYSGTAGKGLVLDPFLKCAHGYRSIIFSGATRPFNLDEIHIDSHRGEPRVVPQYGSLSGNIL